MPAQIGESQHWVCQVPGGRDRDGDAWRLMLGSAAAIASVELLLLRIGPAFAWQFPDSTEHPQTWRPIRRLGEHAIPLAGPDPFPSKQMRGCCGRRPSAAPAQ